MERLRERDVGGGYKDYKSWIPLERRLGCHLWGCKDPLHSDSWLPSASSPPILAGLTVVLISKTQSQVLC